MFDWFKSQYANKWRTFTSPHWLVFLAFMLNAAAIVTMKYVPGDGDSRFYIFVARQIADSPLLLKISPQWNGHQGIPKGHFIQDHLVGLPFTASLGATIGIDPGHTLMLINLGFLIGSSIFLYQLLRIFSCRRHSWAILCVMIFFPIAFLYRVRANHEPAVLFFSMMALWATALGVRSNILYLIGIPAALFGLCFVKGFMAAFLIPLSMSALCFLLWQKQALNWRVIVVSWCGSILFALLISGMFCYFYEVWYRLATGKDFFSTYWQLQIVSRSLGSDSGLTFPLDKIRNVIFYTGCLLWYTFPWSVFFIVNITKSRSIRTLSTLQSLLLLTGMAWIATACISNRITMRYIFPSYFLCGAAFTSYIFDNVPFAKRIIRNVPESNIRNAAILLWGAFTFLFIYISSL